MPSWGPDRNEASPAGEEAPAMRMHCGNPRAWVFHKPEDHTSTLLSSER